MNAAQGMVALPTAEEMFTRLQKARETRGLPLQSFCSILVQATQGRELAPTDLAGVLVRSVINYSQGRHGGVARFLLENMEAIINAFIDDEEIAAATIAAFKEIR
jgi:hypothetical protein